jgi:glycerol-3-phosphate dehydrogenase
VKYGIKEYACTAVDMISRRTRLAFLNVQAAEEALPRIVELMGRELNWSELRKQVLYKSLYSHSSVGNHVTAWSIKANLR